MSTHSTPETLEAALRYAAMRWSVIPLDVRSKRPLKGLNWKRFMDERPRRRELEGWFSRGDCNVGIVLGKVSQYLAVRDFDQRQAYIEWATAHPELARALPTCRTARGNHVYFLANSRDPSIQRKNVLKFADGELRLAKCYVVAPPSRHPERGFYSWEREPFHGLLAIYDVVSAGFIPQEKKIVISSARARDLTPCHVKPLHSQVGANQPDLFSPSTTRQNLFVPSTDIDQILQSTLPTGPGMREQCLWHLARRLKAYPSLKDLPIGQLESIIRQWWTMALPVIRTKDWYETWGAFTRCWERVVVPATPGTLSLQEIVRNARQSGCPEDLRERFGSDPCGLAAAICRELALNSNDGTFFLHRDTLASFCGISKGQASACLRALKASGVIRIIAPPEEKKSTVYFYLKSLH